MRTSVDEVDYQLEEDTELTGEVKYHPDIFSSEGKKASKG